MPDPGTAAAPMASGPLAGIRIVDFSQLLPGPLASKLLADWGAQVIRVLPPHGDLVGRMFVDEHGVPLLDEELNANKDAIVLDLKQPGDRERALELCRSAHAVMESSRPGVMARLGLGYEVLAAHNCALVYCSITGYGQRGVYHDRAGHDINYLALTGLLDQTGGSGEGPALANFPVADILGGSMAAAARLCASLVGAMTSHKGEHLDISMTGTLRQLNLIASIESRLANADTRRGAGYLSGRWPCYRVYRTADNRFFAVGAMEQKFWALFCDTIGLPHLSDKGFAAGDEGRRAIEACARVFAMHPFQHWRKVFDKVDCCVTPVLTQGEAAIFFAD